MDIDSRIAAANQKFNTKNQERDEHLKQADECLTEMTKLQGEWRLLQELKEQPPVDDDEPTVEVIDEGKSKKEGK